MYPDWTLVAGYPDFIEGLHSTEGNLLIMINDLVKIIGQIKNKISDTSDVIWTKYETAKEFRDDLDGYITRLKVNDKSCLEELKVLFAPTGSFQEHSISNGWSDEYLMLAEEFDKIYYQLKE